jgi:hypothetical protein
MFNFNIIEKFKLVFNIDKKKKESIGILNKGRDNKFIDNEFNGLDVGIKDEGENTEAKNNKFKSD